MQKDSKEIRYEKLNKALIKKAFGYDCVEVVEEYVDDGGEIRLNKKKVTKKNVPPDMTALKFLLDSEKGVSEMSVEELEAERERLMGVLAKKEKLKKME